MSGTKERILAEALKLFSENGYEAVSVSQLAAATGIKAPSLYKHYGSKQEIFDALIEKMLDTYEKNSIMAFSNEESRRAQYEKIASMTPEEFAETVRSQVFLITSHPVISRTRKLLIIEQFRNPVLKEQMEKHNYSDITEYHTGLVGYLTEKGILKECDAATAALQLTAPISAQIERIDRNPACIEEAEKIIKKHVIQFFAIYGKEGDKQNA